MSHRKVHSQGSIPFSWESSPGISRFAPNGCSVVMIPDSWVQDQEPKIPPPPGAAQPAKRCRSVRARFRRVQDDPFLAAYKECTRRDGDSEAPTKVSSHCGDEARGDKKGSPGKKKKKKKGSAVFSCKSSWDVREDNFLVKKSSNTVVPPPRSVVPVRKCPLVLQ